jgi:pyrroline-5-carboxylate reductase
MKIGFIGAGNMGKALALAVIKKAPKENIYISNRTPKKAKSSPPRTLNERLSTATISPKHLRKLDISIMLLEFIGFSLNFIL